MADLHWTHLPQAPLQPLLLARDASPEAGLADLQAVGERIGYTVKAPRRSEIALRGKAALGLGLTEPSNLARALEGRYAAEVWGDQRAALEARWPALAALLAAFFDATSLDADPPTIRDQVWGALSRAPEDKTTRALRFCWRAWHLRQQMLAQRPLSLIPAVGGNALADVQTFTPVLTWLGSTEWQVGWPGDQRPDAPHRYTAATPTAALEVAWPLFSRWYGEEERTLGERLKAEARRLYSPPPLTLGVWIAELRAEGYLDYAGVSLENVSHGQIFRLTTPRRGQMTLRGTPEIAAATWLMAVQQYGRELPPLDGEIVTAAYLELLLGESASFVELPDFDARPLSDVKAAWQVQAGDTVYQVGITPPQTLRGLQVVGVTLCAGRRALVVAAGKGALELRPLANGRIEKQRGSVSMASVPLREAAWQQALGAWALYTAAKGGA